MLSVKASQAWSSLADFILGGNFLWSSLKILNSTPYSLKSSLAPCAPSVWFTHSSYFKEQTHLITGWWFGAPCLKWGEGIMSSALLPFESANSKKRNQIFVLFLSCLWLLNKAWALELSIPGPAASRASSVLHGVQFSSVQSRPTLCDPMDCSTPGLPVHCQLPEFTQTHVHWVGDAIQPSHPLSSSSLPALNLPQHQGLFKWVSSSHQVAKVLEFQLQHQSFQWIFRVYFL